MALDRNFFIWVLPMVLAETLLFVYAFTSDLRTCQVVLGLLGLYWCLAALWVEVKLEQVYPGFDYANPEDPEMKSYRPFCDFAPWANCSKVLMSPPGRFLRYFGIAKQGDGIRGLIDVPNPTLGVLFFACHLFYPLLLLLPIPFIPQLFYLACWFVGVMTVWLAYNLVFVLADFCVVCVSMYVANFGLIPMMRSLASEGEAVWDLPFFGDVPRSLLLPFLALDAVMGLAVLFLYLKGPSIAAAREYEDHHFILVVDE
eukprot:TRINITY_DN71257_c0_g1_i1.p1 TRINITY_DN71257_c0_g1~~TRINITY_DN71257_c0_g1_i1.p1  ORF type:complete len:266 (+),score=25.51 TRINITY_DN71257_c0_g1_i1:29-799(+)